MEQRAEQLSRGSYYRKIILAAVWNLDGNDRWEAPLVVLAANGGELRPSNRAKEQGLKMGPVSLLDLDLTSSGGRYWSKSRGRLDTAHCESQACKD